MSEAQGAQRNTKKPTGSALVARMSGTETGIDTIAKKLQYAEEHCHLVTAASSAAPPVGCAVAFSAILMVQQECYSVGGGKFAIASSALMRLAAAMRISWDGTQSGRIDDGSDPRRCAYKAVGHYRALDGQVVWVSGEVELDLNDGSDQCIAMKDRAGSAGGFEKQLRDTRLYILRHAETKAKARAIRQAAGIRSYTADELKKPFVIPALVFTGHSDDPEVRRALAIEMGKAMLSSNTALYGAPEPTRAPAPDVAELPPTFEDYDAEGEIYDRPDWNDQ